VEEKVYDPLVITQVYQSAEDFWGGKKITQPKKPFEKPTLDKDGKPFERKPRLDKDGKEIERKPRLDKDGKPFERKPRLDKDGKVMPRLDKDGKPFERKPRLDKDGKEIERKPRVDKDGKPFERKPRLDQDGKPFERKPRVGKDGKVIEREVKKEVKEVKKEYKKKEEKEVLPHGATFTTVSGKSWDSNAVIKKDGVKSDFPTMKKVEKTEKRMDHAVGGFELNMTAPEEKKVKLEEKIESVEQQ